MVGGIVMMMLPFVVRQSAPLAAAGLLIVAAMFIFRD